MHWMRRRPQGSEIQRLAANADYCHRYLDHQNIILDICYGVMNMFITFQLNFFHIKIKILSASDQNTMIH